MRRATSALGCSVGKSIIFSGRVVQENRIGMGSWNIGSLIRKLMEILDTMIRRRINIAYLWETRWVGEKSREIDH
jgi:hypothetical protein